MTQRELTKSRAIPGFSVLKMKQEIQDKNYQETKDMTTEEHLAYIRKGSEAFRSEMASRRTEREQ